MHTSNGFQMLIHMIFYYSKDLLNMYQIPAQPIHQLLSRSSGDNETQDLL